MDKGLKERVERLEKRLISAALQKARGVQSLAARELGISERVLRYKMRKYGLKAHTKLSGSDRIVENSIPAKRQKIG